MAEQYADPNVFNMDYFRLDGKVALVTGGTYGIGFAVATALAKAGAKIVFNDRHQEKLYEGIAHYKAEGIDAHGYPAERVEPEQRNKKILDGVRAAVFKPFTEVLDAVDRDLVKMGQRNVVPLSHLC